MAFFYSFIYRCLKERPAAPDRLFCFTALSYPVFQHKTRYPL
ncbi:VagD, partial [Salmonella enterica subsp. enterica serovar Typhimurium]|nr:VagD [Salmonella enterica subsp. enterica serovar Typhimurium]